MPADRLPDRPANGTPPQPRWRRGALVGVKLAHSAIFLVNSAAVLHLFAAGLRGRPSRWTGPALAAALTESAVFVANRGRCPLTAVAEGLGAEDGRVSDIFLPRWFADRIPQLCTPPLLIGVLGLALHRSRRKGNTCPRRRRPAGSRRWAAAYSGAATMVGGAVAAKQVAGNP